MDVLDHDTWKSSFFKSNFNTDQSLSEYTQKSDLESLKRDLKNYGTELQLQMSDILKNETEAIVNLAEYLTNLNSKMDNLSSPICQLREEIRTLYDLVKEAELSYTKMLDNVKNNNSKQNHVHLKLGIISSSVYVNTIIDSIKHDYTDNLLTLERVVNKYSFQKTYLDELNLMTPEIAKLVRNAEHKLVEKINKIFLKAFKDCDSNILLRCLRMYVNLQKQDEAHESFQTNILRPELRPLFTEKYLEKCGYDLEKIYIKVKNLLENEVEVLTKIILEHPDLNSFNFVICSLWKEFDKQAREGLPHITAPGNPELFQKRFTCTYELLKYIAQKGQNEALLCKDESFQNHLKRFNLPVYFEIKFQQISGNFESDAFSLSVSNMFAGPNKHNFQLKPSEFLWNGLSACFHKDVFIDQLADNFIRLSLLLLSRYLRLLEKLIKDVVASDASKVDSFVINCLMDLYVIKTHLAPNDNKIESTLFYVLNRKMWPILIKIFKVNNKAIKEVEHKFINYIVDSKSNDCTSHLQNVTAIPRLYRRTNRSPPKEASSYMVEAVKPILTFSNSFKSKLGDKFNDIVNSIILKITNQYLSLVQEVLMSVCKTEESLRRLKGRTQNVSDDTSHGLSDTMSDETKIREQIKYDVGYFYDKLYPLSMLSAKEAMNCLKKEVSQ